MLSARCGSIQIELQKLLGLIESLKVLRFVYLEIFFFFPILSTTSAWNVCLSALSNSFLLFFSPSLSLSLSQVNFQWNFIMHSNVCKRKISLGRYKEMYNCWLMNSGIGFRILINFKGEVNKMLFFYSSFYL